MRLLILGGTRFVGRHLAAAALARGHELTLFNRGLSAPELFPDAERLRGDRETGDLRALAGRGFDAVLDASGLNPAQVEGAARLLGGALDLYAFVSSISVYPQPLVAGVDESTRVMRPAAPPPAAASSERRYGMLKALAEEALERLMPGRALRIRPGLIVGPHDPTERFAYWPRRVAEGGSVLAGESAQPVQAIDARDLAGWLLDLVERGVTGVFNAAGPERPLDMRGLLSACDEVGAAGARIEWAGDAFLLEQGVEPWEELPLWVPLPHAGLFEVDASRALASGLALRPLRETIADTLAWDRSRAPGERRERLSRARERELLRRLAGDP